jgi:hypothetical protein
VQTFLGFHQADFAKATPAADGFNLAELMHAAAILSSHSMQNSRDRPATANRKLLWENTSPLLPQQPPSLPKLARQLTPQ